MNWYRKLLFTFLYFRDPPWDTNISPPELIDFLQNRTPGRAIDMGCGTGTNVITLAKYKWDVIGIDYVRKAIRTAKRKTRKANIQAKFRVGDVTDTGWIIQPMDLVLDIGCLHALGTKKQKTYIQNLGRILAPEGTFLLYTFIKGSDTNSPGLTITDLERMSNYFELIAHQDGKDGDRDSGWFNYRKSKSLQEDI